MIYLFSGFYPNIWQLSASCRGVPTSNQDQSATSIDGWQPVRLIIFMACSRRRRRQTEEQHMATAFSSI